MMEYKFKAKQENIDFARIARENEGVKVLVVTWKNRRGAEMATSMLSDAFLARCNRVGIHPEAARRIQLDDNGDPVCYHWLSGPSHEVPGWKFGAHGLAEATRQTLTVCLKKLLEAEKAVVVTVTTVVI